MGNNVILIKDIKGNVIFSYVPKAGDEDTKFALRDGVSAGVNFQEADLTGKYLNAAVLMYGKFYGARFFGNHMVLCNGRYGDFREADFNNCKLMRSDFYQADFEGANLRYANFAHAYLVGADLRNSDLRGADLTHSLLNFTDLRGVKFNEQTKISKANFFENVLMDDELKEFITAQKV